MVRKSARLMPALVTALLVHIGGAAGAGEVEIAGVSLPEEVRLDAGQSTLVLNGAGIRKKFVVKVYVGALYLTERHSAPRDILRDKGPKKMVMHILMEKVGADKMADATDAGFRKNQSPERMAALEERLRRFNEYFPETRRGDRVEIDFLSGGATVVRLNGVERGKIEGEDFAEALLAVWLGDKPADKNLKKALLGE